MQAERLILSNLLENDTRLQKENDWTCMNTKVNGVPSYFLLLLSNCKINGTGSQSPLTFLKNELNEINVAFASVL